MMKHAYFVTVIDAVFRMRRVYDKQTWDAFQPSRKTGVRLLAVKHCLHHAERYEDELGHEIRCDSVCHIVQYSDIVFISFAWNFLSTRHAVILVIVILMLLKLTKSSSMNSHTFVRSSSVNRLLW